MKHPSLYKASNKTEIVLEEYIGILKSELPNLCKSLINFKIYIKGPLSGLRQFLTIESPLKIKINAFHFIFFLFLRYLQFYPDFLFMWENDLIRTLRFD